MIRSNTSSRARAGDKGGNREKRLCPLWLGQRIVLVLIAIFQVAAVQGYADVSVSLPEDTPSFTDSLNVRRLGRTLFEPLFVVEYSDGVCYINSYNDLFVLDVRDTANIFIKCQIALPEPLKVRGMFVDGSFIYLTKGIGGLYVVERVAEDRLEIAGSYVTGKWMGDIIVSNNLAYVSHDSCLTILDVSNPGNIAVVGDYNLGIFGSFDLFLADTLCYATCGPRGLKILNVSNPEDPEEIGAYEEGYMTSVCVKDGFAYVDGAGDLTGLNVFDVHDPGNIELIGTLEYNGTGNRGIAVYSHYVVVLGSIRLNVIDVRDPENMEVVCTFYDKRWQYDFSIDLPILYLVGEMGLRIMDLSDPSEMNEIGFYGGNHGMKGVHVVNNYAYLADYRDWVLYVVDLTNPRFPRIASAYPVDAAYDVYVDGNLAYVTSVTDGFFILDVTDPDSIIQVGHIDIDARGVVVRYPYAYLAREEGDPEGLQILDVSRPDSIVALGYAPTEYSYKVDVEGNWACIAGGFYGIYLINISDPENPYVVSQRFCYDMVTDVKVSGHYIYAAAGFAGVRVFDASDPSHPREIAPYVGGYGNQLHIVEPYLYLAGGADGLRVVDISVPDSLHEVGYYEVPSQGGIFADNERIYMGTNAYGFYLFEFLPTGIISDTTGHNNVVPRSFSLHQNYPNPFNPVTTISFVIPGDPGSRKRTRLIIYDSRGRFVRTLLDSELSAGTHKATWDGRSESGERVSSGLYFYVLKCGDSTHTRKMIVVR